MMEYIVQRFFSFGLGIVALLISWQGILILSEPALNGVKWQYGTIGFYGVEVVLWGCLALFIFLAFQRLRVHGGPSFVLSPDRRFIVSLMLFVAYAYVSYFWSLYPDGALNHARHLLGASILFFLFLFARSFVPVAWSFFVGACINAVVGIWQFLFQETFSSTILGLSSHPVWESGVSVVVSGSERWLRAYGLMPHPNMFGGLLVVGLLASVFLSIRTTGWRRVLLLSGVVFLSFALVYSWSRSAWLATGILGLVTIIWGVKQKEYIVVPLVILWLTASLAAGATASSLFSTRLSVATPNEVSSLTSRVDLSREAMRLFSLHPWFGVGMANFTAGSYLLDTSRGGWEYQPVHNVLLLILVELGVCGFLLFFFSCLFFVEFHVWYGKGRADTLFFALFLAPIALFDHYLFSSLFGLLLVSFACAMIIRFSDPLPHRQSTGS